MTAITLAWRLAIELDDDIGKAAGCRLSRARLGRSQRADPE